MPLSPICLFYEHAAGFGAIRYTITSKPDAEFKLKSRINHAIAYELVLSAGVYYFKVLSLELILMFLLSALSNEKISYGLRLA